MKDHEFIELLVDIRNELKSAEKYAVEAAKHKMEYPELSALYGKIANEKMMESSMLSKQAATMAEKHGMHTVWIVESELIDMDMEHIKNYMEHHK